MRKTVLVLVGCLVLVTGPAWAGGAFSLFGTYGQTNEWNRSFGAGARVSFGGERLMGDFTATWFPSSNGTVAKNGSQNIYDTLQIIPLDIGLRYMFSPGSELRPYIGAGASYTLINLSSGSADDEWGYYGVAGFGIFMFDGGGGFYVELLYRKTEATLYYGGNSVDADLGGVAGTVGFTWTF